MTLKAHAADIASKAAVPVPVIIAIITAVSQMAILCIQEDEPDEPPEEYLANQAERRPRLVKMRLNQAGRDNGLHGVKLRLTTTAVMAKLKDRSAIKSVIKDVQSPPIRRSGSD